MNIIAEYTNGNILTTLCSDGTRIKYTNDDEFVPAFFYQYLSGFQDFIF